MTRFASVIVSNHGFRDPAASAARLALGVEIAEAARAAGAAIAILPAGFIVATDGDALAAAAADLAAPFSRAGVCVVAGIDVLHAGLVGPSEKGGARAATTDPLVRAGALPYFVFAGE